MAMEIVADNELIFASDGYIRSDILAPTLKLEVNKAGSLEFTILPSDPHYDMFEKLKTIVMVVEDGDVIFRGRVLTISVDFFKQKKITCEGDTAFLLDSVFEPYTGTETIAEFFESVIENHNAQMGLQTEKQFTVGYITVPDAEEDKEFDITSFSDSNSTITSELLESYGGILTTRYVNNVAYIDLIADPSQSDSGFYINTQPVEFAINLLDVQSDPPVDDIFSILYPIGSDNTVTIAPVNEGSVLLENPVAVATYGRIIKSEQWSDISDPAALLAKAQEYLDKHTVIYPDDLTVKAIDLHYLDPLNNPSFRLMDRIQCYSEPHGINIILFCLSIDYDLINPENNSYKIGSFIPSDKHKDTSTDSSSSTKSDRKGGKSSKSISKKTSDNKKTSEKVSSKIEKQVNTNKSNIAKINSRLIQIGLTDADRVAFNTDVVDLTALVDARIHAIIGY